MADFAPPSPPFGNLRSAAVSFVLFNNPTVEVDAAVTQVLDSPADIHVFLIDNTQPSLELPEYDPARVTVIRAKRNLGYGSGHNLAFAQTSNYKYHFVLNVDLTFGPEVIPYLINFLDNNVDIGLAMPRVVYPDGRIQHLCRLLPTPIDVFGRGFFRSSGWVQRRNDRYEARNWTYDQVAEFPFLSGCFMAFRRSIISQIGGFDERFFLYAEDTDLSRRVNEVARTVYVPMVTAVHAYTSEHRPSLKLTQYKIMNLARYFNKWGWLFDSKRRKINKRTLTALQLLP